MTRLETMPGQSGESASGQSETETPERLMRMTAVSYDSRSLQWVERLVCGIRVEGFDQSKKRFP